MTDWIGVSTAIAATASAAVSIIVALRVSDVKATVAKVEVNTNSMSERLERAAHVAGQLQGSAEERAKAEGLAAALAQGRAEEKAAPSAEPLTITADQIVTEKIVTGTS